MKFKKKYKEEVVGFQVSSMIDIVFLLLIFFIVASQMKELELSEEVTLPIADASRTKQSDGMREIQINVLADGTIQVGGQEFAVEDLSAQLQQLASDEAHLNKIVIRGDQQAHYGRIMNIMRQCAQAGLWNVSFSSYQEPPPDGPPQL